MSNVTQQGFTLLEVLIASGILALTSGAIVLLGQASLRTHNVAVERTQAYGLVEEALEIVHQMRDTTFIDGRVNEWDSPFITNDGPFSLEWNTLTEVWEMKAGTEEIPLGNLTFARSVTVTDAPVALDTTAPLLNEEKLPVGNGNGFAENAKVVTVTVTWPSDKIERSITGQTLLTNWK